MSNLTYDKEKSNLGGISQLKFIYEKQLSQKIEIIKGQALEFVASSEFIVPDVIFESSSFKEDKKGVNLFEYEFKAFIARDDIEKVEACIRLDSNKIIALVKDNNNQTRLLGQKDNACALVLGFNKGASVSDRNAYELAITWKSTHRAAMANDAYIQTSHYQFEDGVFYDFDD